MAYVYRHIRLDKNKPFYIGIGSDINYNRSKDNKKRNSVWKKITSKTFYEIEIIFDNLSWKEACVKEIEFISLYGRLCNNTGSLANLSLGGEGYLDPSKEVKEKLSKSKLGNKNPMYKKEITEEHRNNLKLSRKNKTPIPAKSLINTVTNEKFDNIYEAAKYYNITHKALYKRISRNSKKSPLKFIKNA
jgi:hypothetical protein